MMSRNYKFHNKFGILCGCLLTSLFFSCKKTSHLDLALFEVSTSGCFKTCPILDAKLSKDIIYYDLMKFTNRKGAYRYKLTQKDIDTLNYLINSIDLNSLKKIYSSDTPDVLAYNTKFIFKGKEQKVFLLENEGPEEYQNIINYLISLKEKEVVKIDTILNISTRKGMEIINIPIPPVPQDEN